MIDFNMLQQLMSAQNQGTGPGILGQEIGAQSMGGPGFLGQVDAQPQVGANPSGFSMSPEMMGAMGQIGQQMMGQQSQQPQQQQFAPPPAPMPQSRRTMSAPDINAIAMERARRMRMNMPQLGPLGGGV